MKIKLRLRIKLLLSILAIAAMIFWASIYFLSSKVDKVARENIYSYIEAATRENSNNIKGQFEKQIGMAMALAQGFQNFKELTYNEIKTQTFNHLEGVAKNNPSYLSVWASWELWAIDSEWDKPYGRERYTCLWENNNLKQIIDRLNEIGDDELSLYYQLKVNKKEAILDPYLYTYTGSTEKVLETSICVPLISNGKFAALFGFDVELSHYQKIIKNIRPFNGSFAVLLSNNGTIVAHPNTNLIGLAADSILNERKNLLATLKQNGRFANTITLNDTSFFASFVSFGFGDAQEKWYLGIYVPEEVIEEQTQKIAKQSRAVMMTGLLFLAVIIWIISYSITRPLVKATLVLGELSLGKIDPSKKIEIKSGDEIEDIGNSINILIDSLYKTAQFAKEIGKGNLNVPFTKLSNDDVLGEALLEMRKSLEHANKIDEERKIEEFKNRWYNEGVAKFAEILRHNTDNLNEFSYEAIHNLTKYVNGTIGAIFIKNSDNLNDVYLELLATYAYEKRKYEEKNIRFGEGLVGRCAQEAETIYITEIPKGYIKIASGLGEDEPTVLLLVPMKINDEVHGVIELASFESIEDYQIKFIEKIGENIAATISNVKINIRTAKLLEESRIKSEELASQEEEMRQNMEELQATQEESARKSAEMESLINALHSSSYVIEYDLNGHIISVNQAYLALTGQTESDVVGSHHSDNIEMNEEQKLTYQKFWQDLRNGIIKKETNKVRIGGKTFTFIETYSPILNENRKVVKILKIAHNITDFIENKNDKLGGIEAKKKK